MQLSDEVLKGLGLTADATEAEVNAALLARLTTSSAPVVDITSAATETAPPATATDTTELPVAAASVAPAIPEGMVLVDAAAFEEVRAGAALARSLHEQNEAQVRARVLDDAIRLGKFPPARREHYEAMLKADPEGGVAVIESLSAGLIPVVERGADTTGTEVAATAAAELIAYPSAWRTHVAAAQRGSSSRVKVGAD